MSSPHGATFRSHLLAGAIATVLAAMASFVVHHTSAMHLYEELNFDAWILGHAESRDDLFLVLIDEESYLEDFALSSPLSQRVVQGYISAAAARGAGVIGVDLDTRDWDPDVLGELPESVRQKIVWARLPLGAARARQPDRKARYEKLLELQPCGGSVVLGATDASRPAHANATGRIRTMPQSFEIDDVMTPPFGDLVTWVFREGPRVCGQSRVVTAAREYIRFLRRGDDGLPHVPVVPVRALLSETTGTFGGSIVLIGGTFTDTGDVVPTPFGRQYGVAVHADIVHTRLAGSPYRSWPSGRYFLLDLVLGLSIVVFSWLVRDRRALFWVGFAAIGFGTLAASLGAFQWGSQYLSVWPVVVGVSLHEAVEKLAPQYWRTILADLKHVVARGRVAVPGVDPPPSDAD